MIHPPAAALQPSSFNRRRLSPELYLPRGLKHDRRKRTRNRPAKVSSQKLKALRF
jgi:hypothetical protein